MNLKTGIKVLICTCFIGLTFIGVMVLTVVVIPNVIGAYLSILFASLVVAIIVGFAYPILFKDYIKEFWEKQEKKEEERK